MTRWLIMLITLLIILDIVVTIDSASDFNKKNDPNVEASDIIDSIARGEHVSCNNCTITGDWDLAKLRSREIGVPISITDSTIEGRIDFSSGENATFQDNIDFGHTTFKDPVQFSKANFKKEAKFAGSQFEGAAEFRHTKFENSTDFADAQFKNYGMFDNSHFNESAGFAGSHFIGPSSFENVGFDKEAHFTYVQFDAIADFSGSTFSNEALFNPGRFSSKAYFDNVTFKGLANFVGSQFNDFASFRNANFEDNLALKDSRIATIEINNIQFSNNSGINLTGSTFSRFLAHWDDIKAYIPKEGPQGPVYIALIKNYRDLQWLADSYDSYYDYRQWDRNHENKDAINSLFDQLDWLFNGYGIRPIKPIIWSCVFILGFAVLFSWNKYFGKKKKKKDALCPHLSNSNEARGKQSEPPKDLIRGFPYALLFSCIAFIPGFTYFSDVFISLEPVGTYSKLAFVSEKIIGAIFIGLIIAAVTRVYITSYAI
jgi:hypothetical protein